MLAGGVYYHIALSHFQPTDCTRLDKVSVIMFSLYTGLGGRAWNSAIEGHPCGPGQPGALLRAAEPGGLCEWIREWFFPQILSLAGSARQISVLIACRAPALVV